MASTNQTTHYGLSQYVGSDKPTYLVDYNQDMSKIDGGIYDAKSLADTNKDSIGTLSNLTTTNKNNLVSAINEVNSSAGGVGNLEDLTTTAKTSAVAAINEVNSKANTIGALTDLITTAKTSVVAAINELDSDIGSLAGLDTTIKTNVVAAINEVLSRIVNEAVGTVKMFAGSAAPTGYLICDGSAVSRSIYANLFSVIGTTYGAGDESTTFNLPNLKGKIVAGLDANDTSFNTLGKTGGEKTHTLNINEIPSHTHALDILGSGGETPAGLNYTVSAGGANSNFTQLTGGGQAHNNLQPYLVMNYIIKY